MGEIDTKPIDSVQTALSFFGHGNDYKKNSPTKDEQEVHKQKELPIVKFQLETKETAYKQALLKIERLHETEEELSTLLIKSDFQKEFYISESREANLRVNELESALERMAHKLSESEEVQKQLLDAKRDLESTKGQLISLESEKADALESAAKAVAKAKGMENQLMEKSAYVDKLQMELKQAKGVQVELKMELEKVKEKENDRQVEIAFLQFEIHKGRSKLAEAEAAEAKAQSEKAALYNALQLMGLEAEETMNENRVLKEAIKVAEESKSSEPHEKKAEELEKKLEVAMGRIGELRTRAEHAISRAEAAEKSKAELEEKIKRMKEQKEKRKAALAALREESASRDFETAYSRSYGGSTKNYQPLGKVLNMKF